MTGKIFFFFRRVKWKPREHWANCASSRALYWAIALEFNCHGGSLLKPFIVQCAFFIRQPDFRFRFVHLNAKDQFVRTSNVTNNNSVKQAKNLMIRNAGMVWRYLFVSLRWFSNQCYHLLYHSAPVEVLIWPAESATWNISVTQI